MSPFSALLLALFAVPLLRLGRPLWRLAGLQHGRLNRWLGRIERRWGPLRTLPVVLFAGWWLVRALPALDPRGAGALALLLLAREQRRATELRCAEWMRAHLGLQPDDFFPAADRAFGPAGGPPLPPETGRAEIYDLSRRPPTGYAVPHCFAVSAWMTRLIMNAESRLGTPYYRDVFDPGARLWGLTVLQLSGARLESEGLDRLDALDGKRLFLFNHVSQTDFAFGFPALDRWIGTPRMVRLRYVIAKDWFIDNVWIHSVGGIGRCIDIAGMVPIDRGSSRDAIASLEQAAQRIARETIDLAIYPQGTRARGQLADDGSTIDAGFYTSARRERARDPLAHVKRGAAHLALDVALALRETATPLHLVLIGIEGAGRLLPKGRLRMQPGVRITYRLGEVITLRPDDVADLSKRDADGRVDPKLKARAEELTAQIERGLARACRIDERLAALFRERLGREIPDHPAVYRLFDHALALRPDQRGPLLERLAALPDTPGPDWDPGPLFDELARL